jgi:hypothetical protein
MLHWDKDVKGAMDDVKMHSNVSREWSGTKVDLCQGIEKMADWLANNETVEKVPFKHSSAL